MSYVRTSYCLTIIALLATIILSFQISFAANSALVLPIIKDVAKPQYYTSFFLGTPPFRVTLSIDLSSPWSWFTCNLVGYNQTNFAGAPNSSTYRVQHCANDSSCIPHDSFLCYDCSSPNCNPKGKSCMGEVYPPLLYFSNPWIGHTVSPLITDVITLFKSNSSSTLSQKRWFGFPFVCGYTDDLKGLSHYTKGVLSLSRKELSLPSLISKSFKLPNKFALCLPSSSSTGKNGALFFGGGPYYLPPFKLSLSRYFITTPLIVNPVDIGISYEKRNASIEYYVNVKSILVEGTALKFDRSLLSINKTGFGGTKINPIYPYTVLHTSIYRALYEVFVSKAVELNITQVSGDCFYSKTMSATRTGPRVPTIDLVLEGKNSVWRIDGFNSMRRVSNEIRCLAFVDGGSEVTTSIVIGGKQMEDSVVEFDLESSTLGVTSSLLRFGTSCSQFQAV